MQDKIDSQELNRRAEELIKGSSNRYRITVQVAKRAKRRRYEDFDNPDEPLMKPVPRAIVEMSDELMQPEIISDTYTRRNTPAPTPTPVVRSNRAPSPSPAPTPAPTAPPPSPAPTPTRVEIKAQEIEKAVESNKNLSRLKTEANPSAWDHLIRWIAESVLGLNFQAAKGSVSRLEERCGGQSSKEIAHKLIVHKSLQAAGFEGFRDTAVDDLLGELTGIPLSRLSKLSAEMVYQIADVYDFPLNPLEAVAIFGATFLVDTAINVGVGWLSSGVFPGKLLSAPLNGLTIYAIGHLACAFYEFKAKGLDPLTSAKALDELKQESAKYLSNATSEDAIRNKIATEIEQAFPYTRLESLLSEHRWEDADRETGNIVWQLLAMNGALIPSESLRKIDRLWRENSDDHFGFSVQRRIYVENRKELNRFAEAVGWGETRKTGLLRRDFRWNSYYILRLNDSDWGKGEPPEEWSDRYYWEEGKLPAFWLDRGFWSEEESEGNEGDVVKKHLIPILKRNDW